MPAAALRPAPIARITVAPPVTISPPAKTPLRDVFWLVIGLDVTLLGSGQAGRGRPDDRIGGGSNRDDRDR